MIERLFDLVKGGSLAGPRRPTEVPASHGPKFTPESTKQTAHARRLHGHMKRTTPRLVAATLRTGFLVGVALILILVLLPAALAAQAAGLR
jgi:hypothetical protein